MVAYVLPHAVNETAIRDGRRFALLARPRAEQGRNRHARPGEALQLTRAANRESPARALPAAACIYSGLVSFSADGVVRVISQSVAHPGTVEGVAAHLANAEQGSAQDRDKAAQAVAAACGFKDYAELWASIAGSKADVVARQLIAWVRA